MVNEVVVKVLAILSRLRHSLAAAPGSTAESLYRVPAMKKALPFWGTLLLC
jgi:hypothetical protein